jgi:drug/metabolite transporter superfamily protein YnfA
MYAVTKSFLLFVLAGLCEVGGGEAKHPKPLSDVLFCRWMRERP